MHYVPQAAWGRRGRPARQAAETKKEEIIRVLTPFLSDASQKQKIRNYYLDQIISLSDNPKLMREKIINEYRLINGNNRFLEQQLNMLKIDELEFRQKYGN